MRSVLLRGREHTVLETTATVAEGRAAVAISRGGAPKLYAYTHPNEDAALFVEGARGLLVAVADGHWGCEASEAALEELLTSQGEAWTEGEGLARERWAQTLRGGICAAHRAVLNLGRVEAGRPPRTTLAFALARPQEDLLAVASIGDSHLFRVSASSVAPLTEAIAPTLYLGGRSRHATREPHVQVATLPLAGTRVLIAVTDGLSEVGIGVDDPEAAIAEAVERAAKAPAPLRAREASRHLLEAALAAQRRNGSGDNVAAAVAWLGD